MRVTVTSWDENIASTGSSFLRGHSPDQDYRLRPGTCRVEPFCEVSVAGARRRNPEDESPKDLKCSQCLAAGPGSPTRALLRAVGWWTPDCRSGSTGSTPVATAMGVMTRQEGRSS